MSESGRNEFLLRQRVHARHAQRGRGPAGAPPALRRRGGAPGRRGPQPVRRAPAPLRRPARRGAAAPGHAVPPLPAVRPDGHPQRGLLQRPAAGDGGPRVPARLPRDGRRGDGEPERAPDPGSLR